MKKSNLLGQFLFLVLLIAGSESLHAREEWKYRILLSAPLGASLSGFNAGFFITCDGEKNSGYFSDLDEYSYVQYRNSSSGEITSSVYTQGLSIKVTLLECDSNKINQKVLVELDTHYLKELKRTEIRPFYEDLLLTPSKQIPDKVVFKQRPIVTYDSNKNVYSFDTTGTIRKIFSIADTQFSMSVTRF
jgi:hypothetical protein